MNSFGIALILRSGCLCTREKIDINGRKFTVREQIAQGGFSTVELVEDIRTHESFALKRIVCHSSEDQRLALSEVEVHRLVEHPRVLSLVDYDLRGRSILGHEDTSEVRILLPYYSRGTLGNELERRERTKQYLREDDLIRIFVGICEGVESLHSLPIPMAHRDIKPGNVLMDSQRNPILMDLGSAAVARVEIKDSLSGKKLEDTAAERSSMAYRPPELFNVPSVSSIDERTDIWSLGCLLYALCFFKSPYDQVHERGDSVALAVVSGVLQFPNDSPYSSEIHEMISWLLKVDLPERPFIGQIIERVKLLQQKNLGCV